MSSSRGIRAIRAVTAASVATFIALFGHIIGGGGMPALIGVFIPLTISTFVSLALIGRGLATWRIAAVVMFSQWLFHTLFVLGSPGSATSLADHAMGHPMGDAIMVSAHTMSTPVMGIGHVCAAVLTTIALVRGEVAVRRLLAATARVLTRFTELHPIDLGLSAPWRPIFRRAVALTPLTLGAKGTRGPPAVI